MDHSEQLNELAAALAQAQAKFPSIIASAEGKIEGTSKQSGNEYKFSYKYADLPSVVETVRPILSEHGLSVSQFIGVTDGGNDTLTTVLLHTSGQWMSGSMRLYLKKQDSQGQGSAITYARRYSFMAALGLVADDDDDGNAASQPNRQQGTKSGTQAPSGAQRNGGQAEGKKGQNLQKLMMRELDGTQRPQFLAWMSKNYSGTSLTDVPESLVSNIENAIQKLAVGEVPV